MERNYCYKIFYPRPRRRRKAHSGCKPRGLAAADGIRRKKNGKLPQLDSVSRSALVTPSGESTNFLMEDVERVLQIETLET